MTKKRDLTQRQTFEKYGETWVRHLLHTTENKDDIAQALAWLEEQRTEREAKASSKRDVHKQEALAIAKRTNRISVVAAISAVLAAIAAIVSAIITIIRNP